MLNSKRSVFYTLESLQSFFYDWGSYAETTQKSSIVRKLTRIKRCKYSWVLQVTYLFYMLLIGIFIVRGWEFGDKQFWTYFASCNNNADYYFPIPHSLMLINFNVFNEYTKGVHWCPFWMMKLHVKLIYSKYLSHCMITVHIGYYKRGKDWWILLLYICFAIWPCRWTYSGNVLCCFRNRWVWIFPLLTWRAMFGWSQQLQLCVLTWFYRYVIVLHFGFYPFQ